MTNKSTTPSILVTGTDGLVALGIAIASVMFGNVSRIPSGGLEQFLGMRVTVLNAAFAAMFVMTWIGCFSTLELYRFSSQSISRTLTAILKGCSAMTLILVVYLVGTGTTGPTRRIAIAFLCGSFCFEAFRVFGGIVLRRWIAARDPRRVLILGSGRRACKAWREIRTRYHSTVNVVGFVDDRASEEMPPDIADRCIGTVDQLSDLLLRNVVDELIIAMPVKSCYEIIQQAIAIGEQVGVQVVYMQDVYVSTLKQSTFDNSYLFNELVVLPDHYVAKRTMKRLLDIVGAAVGLCVLAPVFAVVALAVTLTSDGPVFFSQERYGHRRRLFRMYKFRSMVKNAGALMAELEAKNEADGPIFKIKHDPRITPLGRILRASSMDELPQLWNVLRGDMSLVGPRPMSVRDVSLFNEPTLMRRFSVKPGITGLWQVSGRSSVGFDQWMKFDFSYIDEWSLGLDLKILARTVTAVWKGTGAV